MSDTPQSTEPLEGDDDFEQKATVVTTARL